MKDLPRFLLDSANSGLYRVPGPVAVVKQAASACGLAWFDLDLEGVSEKAALLRRCQDVFALPPSFGHNWDALADYIQDLSWRPARGYVVHCHRGREFARDAATDFDTLVQILSAAAAYWTARNKPCIVLFDAQTGDGLTLKDFPA
jgi:RNAse (barnase) inhibitor barstar